MGSAQTGTRIATIIGLTACFALSNLACSIRESADDPHQRLASLGNAWLTKPASVTYRTWEREAGEATSTHQCLRQFAGGAVDRQEAIRLCSGEGSLTFIQDPPTAWRMDVSIAGANFTLISTPSGSHRCSRSDTDASRCTGKSGGAGIPFEPILRRPDEVLSEMRIPVEAVTRSEDRDIAGLHAECFSAASSDLEGEPSYAEWCYSEAGALLSFTAATPTGSKTILEATEVSTEVPSTAFDDLSTLEIIAAIGIEVEGELMHVWLPDLGQDRDVHLGEAIYDIDSPDMAFRRSPR